MNSYVCIENAGEVCLSAIRLVGATDKRNGRFIGQFGSGMKYAIAAALRDGIGVTIMSGKKRIQFGTKDVPLNRETTKAVTMKVGKFGRTEVRDWSLSLGENDWKDKPEQGVTLAYMILREFVSNAIDEGSYHMMATDHVHGESGKTRVFLPRTQGIQDVLDFMPLYFLQSGCSTPLFDGPGGRIGRATDQGRIYCKGIFVRTPPKPTLYDYDFDDLQLTESRTVDPYFLQERIGKLLAKAPANILADALSRMHDGDSWFEDSIASYQWGAFDRVTVNEARVAVAGEGSVICHRRSVAEYGKTPTIRVPDGLYEELQTRAPDIVADHEPKTKTCPTCCGSGKVEQYMHKGPDIEAGDIPF